jgi:AraC-like DNA-binding protein/quercetin dioxygenase-like cupin family protein
MLKTMRDHIALQSSPRPVAAMAKSYPAGYQGYRHSHRRAQFLYATAGCMRLTLEAACWIVPPKRAVWLPPGYEHQTGSIGAVEMRTLYIEETAIIGWPEEPRMLRVSPLLHELVLRAMEIPVEYEENGQQGKLMEVLLREIDWTPVHPFRLPLLEDRRLKLIEASLHADPSQNSTLDQWARRFKVSARTLARLFRSETNLSFQQWRDHARVFAAIPLLSEGRPLVEIADELGFETAWSFTAMFKRVLGTTPSRYRSELDLA